MAVMEYMPHTDFHLKNDTGGCDLNQLKVADI